VTTILRPYEAVYIFDSALEDGVIAEKLAKHQGLLSLTEEATIDHWGRRQLAYPIKKRETGYYVVSRFTTDTSTLPEFERSLKLDDGVLRYLISLHENELGAPPLTEEQLEAKRRAEEAGDDDDDED
jgi:small subunit ribosomal protein S6